MTRLIEIGITVEIDKAMTDNKAMIDNKATTDNKAMTDIVVLIDSRAATTGMCSDLLTSTNPIEAAEEAGGLLREEDQAALIEVGVGEKSKTPLPEQSTRKWRVC